jgi:hypothetical protein
MKIGLDSNVLVAPVKKVGELFHDSSIALSRLMPLNESEDRRVVEGV